MSEPHNPRLIEPDYLQALAVMGHTLQTRLTHVEPTQSHVIDLRHTAPGMDHWQQVTMAISDHHLAAANTQMLAAAVEEGLRALLTDRLREHVGHVAYALSKGPLPCEFIGGHRDGEILTGVATDSDGWPVPRIYVPLPSNPLAWTVLDVLPSAVTLVGTYDREWVNPDTLRWRYLATKGT
jgi:hypothetical protein